MNQNFCCEPIKHKYWWEIDTKIDLKMAAKQAGMFVPLLNEPTNFGEVSKREQNKKVSILKVTELETFWA